MNDSLRHVADPRSVIRHCTLSKETGCDEPLLDGEELAREITSQMLFENANCVAIGWEAAGDLSAITSLDEMGEILRSHYGGGKREALANAAAMTYKFRSE